MIHFLFIIRVIPIMAYRMVKHVGVGIPMENMVLQQTVIYLVREILQTNVEAAGLCLCFVSLLFGLMYCADNITDALRS